MYPWLGRKYFIFVKEIPVQNIVPVLLRNPQHDTNIFSELNRDHVTHFDNGLAIQIG